MKLVQPGTRNSLTDVDGLLVGNASDSSLKSGVTVVLAEQPFVTAVDVRGGAPGTRETDLLAPDKMVEAVDALVLSGGSAFGLDAASGVADGLHRRGRGFAVGPVRVPLVPAAIIFDLLNGGNKQWQRNPYYELGQAALDAASIDFELGTAGAGTGATTANLKGGLGSASLVLDNGVTVAALVVVNARGGVVTPGIGHFWAAPYELNNEFGGRGVRTDPDPLAFAASEAVGGDERANTTIAVVATDQALTKAQAQRMAVAAHDGLARAILPAHTPFDGDLIFAASTGKKPLLDVVADQALLGHAASLCLARAIARGVYQATAASADTLPTWASRWG